MLREVFVVYANPDTGPRQGQHDEISAHNTPERAEQVPRAYAIKHRIVTSIDWVQWEITRHGRDTVDCDADITQFDEEGHRS